MWCMYHHERLQYNGDLHGISLCDVCITTNVYNSMVIYMEFRYVVYVSPRTCTIKW